MPGELRDKIIYIAIHYSWDVATGIVNAVVCDAVLREIVGTDFFAAVACTNEGFASFGGIL